MKTLRVPAEPYLEDFSMTQTSRIKPQHVVIGVLAVAVTILGVLLWQESRTERVEFSIGDQTIELEAEG